MTVTGYLVAQAISQLFYGSLSDKIDRRFKYKTIGSFIMKVFIEGEGNLEVEDGINYLTLLKDMGYHKDHIITLENDRPVPMDKRVKEGVKIKFINVVSGG